MEKMKKIFRSVRFSEEEHAQIARDAKRCGLGVSTYMRQRALGLRPRAKDFTHAINQLSKFGGLLKHLHNEGLGHSAQTAEILTEINKAIRGLHRADSYDSQNPEEAQ